jgi:outer membrane receptor protein involved in Fe transport
MRHNSNHCNRWTAVVGLSLTTLAASLATPVRAQTAAATADTMPQPLEEIVVSASRIDRAGFNAPTPTVVLSQQALEARGTVDIGDLLDEVPAFRATNTPASGGIGNSGAELADLRGLTAQRTLVLLDKLRLPATNLPATTVGGTTDLSIIPTALIRSVDVVTGGASADYGSDAVAGVVNIILDDKLQGIKATAQYGQTPNYDDDKDRYVSLAGGTSFADGKGHIIAGGEYDNNGGTSYYNDQRAWGQSSVASVAYSTRPAGVPANIILQGGDAYFGSATTGGLILTPGPLQGLAFVPGANGGTTTARFTPGYLDSNFAFVKTGFTDAELAANSAAGIDNRNFQQLHAAIERANFLSKLSFDFNDHLTVYIEPLYSHIDTLDAGTAIRAGGGTAALTILPSNYYLQQALTPAQLALVPAKGISLGYLSNQLGPSVNDISEDTSRIVAGLEGHFGETWKWDASYQYGRNNAIRHVDNAFNNANFKNAINAVQVGGQVVCASAAAQAAGCQPLDILGTTTGSPAALAYVLGTPTAQTVTTLKDATANLQGEPFSDWAGPVSIASGLEYRTDSLETSVDPLSQAAAWYSGNVSNLPYHQEDVKEVYVETVVPLLKNLPMARSADFNGAVRETDYSTSGSVTTWKAGLTWEPTSDFLFRGTRSRDIRAPNLVDLYTPQTVSLPLPLDPRPGIVQPTNAAGFTVGGNPNLKPEKSDTTTFGVVFKPQFFSRLKVSADYYRIVINDAITATSTQTVVNNCLTGGVYNGGPYCSLITFANNNVVSGQILAVQGTTANVAQFRTHGVDLALTFTQPLDQLNGRLAGDVIVNAEGTRVFEYWTSTDVSPLFPEGINRAGQTGAGFGGPAGLPSWLWNVTTTYNLERLSANVQVRYISSGHQNNGFIGPDNPAYSPALSNSINDNYIGSYALFNLGGSYDFGKLGGREQVYFVLNNVMNRPPPLPANNNAYYDLIGRYLKLGVRVNFK